MRFLVVLLVLLLPAVAHADLYGAFDVGLAHRFGAYDWKSPPAPGFGNAPAEVHFDARVQGTGVLAHGALGASLPHRFSIAAEGGVGYLAANSRGIAYGGVSDIALGRLGVRVEKRLFRHFFVRGAVGMEWMAFGHSGLDIGAHDNVFEGEPTRGLYAGATAGLRGRHVGGFVRADLGRATSTHATYTPITLSIGLDVAWF